MQTHLAPEFQGTPEGSAAEAILRRCVHCGFCTATCPTYQLLGDELDGPRGRIYLIKQVLEGETPTAATQQHLDRCLTCRNCESTCPSGVQYGQLVEIGRQVVEAKVERPREERVKRWLLKEGLTSPLFKPALRLGQALRPLVPGALKDKVPPAAGPRAHQWPRRAHPRKVLMLMGCVQPAMMPNINAATARVLDAAGVQTLVADEAGCCGAIRAHLNDHPGGLDDARRNIDAWWPMVDGHGGEVEAIVMNASGCGVQVKDYGRLLAHDPHYAGKAARVSTLTRDLSEYLPALVPALRSRLGQDRPGARPRLAYHPPCTLQHGQQLRGGVEGLMRELGFEIATAPSESHLCCGSAGTYSVLQPVLSKQLRERKLAALAPLAAEAIVSANIGCIQHLQSGTGTPVRHWIEVLDDALTA
ncbi:glycolate oxidase iron-sulfur subunit [Mitsuaria sp. BK045]|uniref:glycolate oxidase subunit GlcF n=1 Tax=unclassified Roseateles TaxID=2626991 RepID=UPI00162091A3|nr:MULTISPECIES: glycolate oxidase subunit GlcF [unclassified Roseateles]MBB3295587.1 glycolate oxidase iron-sulfur subunit [Mitsuaria sp. BK041]MBB3364803.1 glycolate oxidase iron-sulfur subunit [Mitsuaria sp. BK045]